MSAIALYLTSGPARSFFLRMGLVMFFIVTFTAVSNAATRTWLPTAGGAWTLNTNWSGGVVPVANDDVVINSNQGAAITAVPTIALHSLSVGGNCTFQSIGNVTLTLGGNAGTDFTISPGYTLILGATVNITLAAGATATINGTLEVGPVAAGVEGETYNTNANNAVTTVNGTILNYGVVTCNTAANLLFQSGSTYNMAANNGLIPISTWNVNSTCLITGYTNPNANPIGYATSFAQSFGNFTWDCTNQTIDISLGAILSTINGNFTMTSTGTGTFSFGNTGIGNINIVGNYIQTGGYLYCSGWGGGANNGAQARVINIAGNFSLTGGTFIQLFKYCSKYSNSKYWRQFFRHRWYYNRIRHNYSK